MEDYNVQDGSKADDKKTRGRGAMDASSLRAVEDASFPTVSWLDYKSTSFVKPIPRVDNSTSSEVRLSEKSAFGLTNTSIITLNPQQASVAQWELCQVVFNFTDHANFEQELFQSLKCPTLCNFARC